MTSKQQSQILAIIAKDCKATCYFMTSHGTCINGALALASGVPKREFKYVNDITSDSALFVRIAICEKFGLTPQRLQAMQRINDSSKTLLDRRKRLRNYIKSIPTK